ncbi:MAG: hypothetical protein Phog2KO_06950 [Phototrophicaceae bacterium]
MQKRVIIILGLLMLSLVACNSTPDIEFSTLPEGDATRGEIVYNDNINGAPSCVSCHLLSDMPLVGPGLAGYGEIASTRIEGLSAEEYTFNAIVRPATHLVDGYSNVMYSGYGTKLSEQELADLISFLLIQ